MCLERVIKIEQVDEDITCYKVFQEIDEANENFTGRHRVLCSPIRGTRWNNPNGATGYDVPHVEEWTEGNYEIGEGAFHSFKDLESAKMYSKCLASTYPKFTFCVCKCKIPKDTNFLYEGWAFAGGLERVGGWAYEKLIIEEFVGYEIYEDLLDYLKF